jgi:hypothetical protein
MTREEMRAALIAKGILETNSRDNLWQEAFHLYNQTQSPKAHWGSCGSCYSNVRAWLKR